MFEVTYTRSTLCAGFSELLGINWSGATCCVCYIIAVEALIGDVRSYTVNSNEFIMQFVYNALFFHCESGSVL